ncbi:hypothetical protein BJY01DRAFT_220955 [Aspergillus pseudoustus]|uniref:Ubiquitin carboxyl-terminal hydrolase n=1 Tax=Aspergillus pseudoustus TaxID=1810923 RepID=A0ABR4JBR3_9EURO
MSKRYSKAWIPLESDPGIFTELMHNLGADDDLTFMDVFSLDSRPWIPVRALILIFPSCDAYKRDTETQTTSHDDKELVWVNQTIDNACGLYAILHCVCNIPDAIKPGSVLSGFMEASNRAAFLESSQEVEEFYDRAAQDGSPALPAEAVDHHYICLVKHKRSNQLYLLDGEMGGPIEKGKLEDEEDVWDGRHIIRTYIDSRKEGTFSLLALVNSG